MILKNNQTKFYEVGNINKQKATEHIISISKVPQKYNFSASTQTEKYYMKLAFFAIVFKF